MQFRQLPPTVILDKLCPAPIEMTGMGAPAVFMRIEGAVEWLVRHEGMTEAQAHERIARECDTEQQLDFLSAA